METTTNQEPARIYYSTTDKHFLGAYYSLARHNVYLTFCHIADRIGVEKPEEDGKVVEWVKENKARFSGSGYEHSIIAKQRFYEYIDRHFPFLRIINTAENKNRAENKPEENVELLYSLIEDLDKTRNYNSHAVYEGGVPNYFLLSDRLQRLFLVNISRVKNDFWGDSVSRSIQSADKVEEHFTHLRPYIKNEDDNKRDKKGKKLKTIPNPRFEKYRFYDSTNNQFTIAGHLFFTSLFLEKKSAVLMQKQIKGFKDGRDIYTQMTTEVFCRTRILLPRVRLYSERTADALMLDMLNELSKAPTALYTQLIDEDKQLFRIDSSDQPDTEDSEAETMTNGDRKENRFPYFALRYFDEANVFERLRFQIDLGNYHFHLYKAKINNKPESRHLIRRLFGFGRITDFNPENAPHAWKEKEKDLDYYETATEPFIAKTYPHYHLEEQKIGIRFIAADTEIQWPSLIPDNSGELPKYKREDFSVAQAFLSVNELLPMAFCQYLYATTGNTSKVETIIEDKLKAFEELMNGLLIGLTQATFQDSTQSHEAEKVLFEKYGLHKFEIPDRLFAYLINQPRERKRGYDEEKLGKLIRQTQTRKRRFEALKTQKKAIGKPGFKTLRSGVFASWLVDDLMRFQPVGTKRNERNELVVDLKSKANPTKYQLLQRTLALYNSEKNSLPGLLAACNLIHSSNEHPFIKQVIEPLPNNWMDFYSRYLNEREKYLHNTKASGAYKQHAHFLRIKESKNDINTMVDGWRRQLMLPVHLFREALNEWMFQNASEQMKQWLKTQKKFPTVEKLIEQYLKWECGDDFQPFYNELRLAYKYYQEEKGDRIGFNFVKRNQLNNEYWKSEHKDSVAQFETKHAANFKALKDAVDLFRAEKDKFRSVDDVKNSAIEFFGASEIHNIGIDRMSYTIYNKPVNLLVLTDNVVNALFKPYLIKLDPIKEYREMLDNEMHLRRCKAEDAMLFFMAKKLMLDVNTFTHENSIPLTLKAFKPIGDKSGTGLLNSVRKFTHEIKFYASNWKNIPQIHSEPLGSWLLVSDDVKIKKLGNLKQLIKDRRINELSKYIQPTEIPIEVNYRRLKKELEIYDTTRIGVLNLFYKLEIMLKDSYTLNKDGFKNFAEIMKAFTACPDKALKDELTSIRNAFLHNQYPSPEKISGITNFNPADDAIPEKDGFTIVKQIAVIAQTRIKEALELINK
jgi:hypothetical protein